MSDKCECKYKPTDRTGLYIMMFIILCDSNGCNLMVKLNRMQTQLNTIEQKLDSIQARNVQANDTTNITHKILEK